MVFYTVSFALKTQSYTELGLIPLYTKCQMKTPVQDHSVRLFIHEYISMLRLHIQFYITSKIDLSRWWLLQKYTHTLHEKSMKYPLNKAESYENNVLYTQMSWFTVYAMF